MKRDDALGKVLRRSLGQKDDTAVTMGDLQAGGLKLPQQGMGKKKRRRRP